MEINYEPCLQEALCIGECYDYREEGNEDEKRRWEAQGE